MTTPDILSPSVSSENFTREKVQAASAKAGAEPVAWNDLVEEIRARGEEIVRLATTAETLKAENAALLSRVEWRPIETAPKDGTHCLLAMKRGPFVWSIQGAYLQGSWCNAADIPGEPLCWMPNPRIPDEFLPWTPEFQSALSETKP